MFVLKNLLVTRDDCYTDLKVYEGCPVYVALHDMRDNVSCLVRFLGDKENVTDFEANKIRYLRGANGVLEFDNVPCLYLLKLKSIEQADGIVSSYRGALDSLQNKC